MRENSVAGAFAAWFATFVMHGNSPVSKGREETVAEPAGRECSGHSKIRSDEVCWGAYYSSPGSKARVILDCYIDSLLKYVLCRRFDKKRLERSDKHNHAI